MNRSRDYVYVPFCMLSQGIRATSIVKVYPAIINPVIELFMQKNINIIQMPCPELIFDGFHRQPCGKPKYDKPENRKVCREVAQGIVDQMKFFKKHGCNLRLVMGIDYSPSCAVSVITGRFRGDMKKGKGIYIEELQHVMRAEGIEIPFVGTRVYKIKETIQAIKDYLDWR
jgi:predicted secreted protein